MSRVPAMRSPQLYRLLLVRPGLRGASAGRTDSASGVRLQPRLVDLVGGVQPPAD